MDLKEQPRERSKKNPKKRIADISFLAAAIRVLSVPSLRRPVFDCVVSILSNFFFLQYKAARRPGLIPVSVVDHPLDEKIPFKPGWVNTYLDFVAFWVRLLGFLLARYGRRSHQAVKDFIVSMGNLYAFAAGVYSLNMSTTKRPFYISRPRFAVIHITDPHLMCIPSLHVMIVIFTYTRLGKIAGILGEGEALAAELEEMRQGALRITEAILFVKQHSVNCVSAAMYAMSRFDPPFFPEAEAEDFASRLLVNEKTPSAADGGEIRSHIVDLYRRFMSEGESAASWKQPLLDFLRVSRKKANGE